MPGIDEPRANLLHEGMSRPFRLVLPAACAALSFAFSACGTLYDDMYSYKKNYFKPPAAKKEASAEDILGAVDANKPAPSGLPVDSSAALPAPSTDMSSLPTDSAAAGAAPPSGP